MADLKPSICGDPKVYVSDRECTDCEKLEKRVTVLEECCAEVEEEIDGIKTDLGKKLEQHDILAGDNVSISYEEDGTIVINSSGGGGGSGLSKTDILTAMGYNEMIIAMTDTEGNHHSWRVMGVRVDENAPVSSGASVEGTVENAPTSNATVTKQEILDAMGYTEFEMEMTDENNETGTWKIIGEQIS